MTYSISFFINGYGQQPGSIDNVLVIPELPILSEEGFIFNGWFLDEDLTIQALEGTALTADLMLYASWTRDRGYNNANTYVATDVGIVGPGVDITPSEPGGGGNTSSTSYYEGSSWFTGAFEPLDTILYDNFITYFDYPTETYNGYVKKGSTVSLPVKSTTDDPWVETQTTNYYYNKNGTKTQIKPVVAGTRPTFKNKLYSDSPSATLGEYVQYNIFISGTELIVKKVYYPDGSVISTEKIPAYYNSTDGSCPKKIILVLQAAGGCGKASGSRPGGGGASGECVIGVFNLRNLAYSISQGTHPNLKIIVPTACSAGSTTSKNLTVKYPTSYAGQMTYTDILVVDGGNPATSTSYAAGSGYASDETGNDYKNSTMTNYDGTATDADAYWWFCPVRTATSGNGYSIVPSLSNSSGGNGYSNSVSGPGTSTGAGYIYCSKYKIGSGGNGTVNNSAINSSYLYLSVGGFDGGARGDYGGGGGASYFAAGGNGATSSRGSGGTGGIGAGGGGSQKGTAGAGGPGMLRIYY